MCSNPQCEQVASGLRDDGLEEVGVRIEPRGLGRPAAQRVAVAVIEHLAEARMQGLQVDRTKLDGDGQLSLPCSARRELYRPHECIAVNTGRWRRRPNNRPRFESVVSILEGQTCAVSRVVPRDLA